MAYRNHNVLDDIMGIYGLYVYTQRMYYIPAEKLFFDFKYSLIMKNHARRVKAFLFGLVYALHRHDRLFEIILQVNVGACMS